MNIYEFAMNMELDGKLYYEKLAKSTSNNSLKTVFLKIAQQELEHYSIIKKFKDNQEYSQDSNLLDVDNIFKDLINNFNLTEDMNTQIEAYEYALKLEDESIDFYIEQRDNSTNSKEKILFERLITEEEKHKDLIDNILEFVSKPVRLRGEKTINSDPEFARWDEGE